jgi:hypothetical protein
LVSIKSPSCSRIRPLRPCPSVLEMHCVAPRCSLAVREGGDSVASGGLPELGLADVPTAHSRFSSTVARGCAQPGDFHATTRGRAAVLVCHGAPSSSSLDMRLLAPRLVVRKQPGLRRMPSFSSRASPCLCSLVWLGDGRSGRKGNAENARQ